MSNEKSWQTKMIDIYETRAKIKFDLCMTCTKRVIKIAARCRSFECPGLPSEGFYSNHAAPDNFV